MIADKTLSPQEGTNPTLQKLIYTTITTDSQGESGVDQGSSNSTLSMYSGCQLGSISQATVPEEVLQLKTVAQPFSESSITPI